MKELDTTEGLKTTTNIAKVSEVVVAQKEQGVRDSGQGKWPLQRSR